MMKKYGKVKFVSATGGIKFFENEEQWYNPANKEIKDLITKDLVGKNVELTLNDKGKVVKVLPVEEGVVIEEEDLTENNDKKEYWDRRNLLIIRQNVLGHATNIAIAVYNRKEDVDMISVEDVTSTIKKIAESLEKWVLR